MVSCQIKGCKNRSDHKSNPKLHFFSFPKDPKVAQKWLELCKKIVNIKNSRVCSAHFKPSCYKPMPMHLQELNTNPVGVRTLLSGAVPTEDISIFDSSKATSVPQHINTVTSSSKPMSITLDQLQKQGNKMFNISNTSQGNSASPILFLQVLNDKEVSSIKSSTTNSPVQYDFNNGNLNIKIESVEGSVDMPDATDMAEMMDMTDIGDMTDMMDTKDMINIEDMIDIKDMEPSHVLDHMYATSDSTISPTTKLMEESSNPISDSTSITIDKLPKINPIQIISKSQLPNLNIGSLLTSTSNQLPNSAESAQENSTSNSDADLIKKLKAALHEKHIENVNLSKQLKQLHREQNVLVNKRVQEVLKSIFSPRQVDKLMHPYKAKIHWTIDDIISSLSLQNISVKAYHYLRQKNYPYPGLSTIRKWTAQIKITEGLISDVFTIMKHKTKTTTTTQNLVVLTFGETNIGGRKCLIGTVRSLLYKWMQPFYCCYDETLSTDIILQSVSKLYEVGLIVVALICKFKPNDITWINVNIGSRDNQRCYFKHPVNANYNIFVFPSDYQILMSMRKHFLNHGLVVKGESVTKKCIEELIAIDKQEEDDDFEKLTEEVLGDCKSNKDHVAKCKLLFSTLTSKQISRYGKDELISCKEWQATAGYFKLVGQWISLFNNKSIENFKKGEEPYGMALEAQNKILNEIENLMKKTKVDGLESNILFQEQVIIRCKSLCQMLEYLQNTFRIQDFNLNYIITNRLSYELMDNLITYLKSESAHSNESAFTRFQSKFRKSILGKCVNDGSYNKFSKSLEPCMVDFNEGSDSISPKNDVLRRKLASTAKT